MSASRSPGPWDVTAVVINYNGARFLKRCLESVLDQTRRPEGIVVVDNASTDDSLALLDGHGSRISLVELPRNLGYAGAANVALRATRAPYLLLINPDVVLTPTFVAALVEFAEGHPDAGSLTGKLLRFPEAGGPAVIDSTGHAVFRGRWVANRGEGEQDRGQYEAPEEVFGVSGAAPLYRRAMLEDIALDGEAFAESFFLYLEDADVDWRARLRGWRAYYVPTAVAYHERGYKGGRRPRDLTLLRHSLKNRYLLLIRNDAVSNLLRDAWAVLLMEALRFLDFLLTAPRALAGYLDALRLLPAALAQRRAIRRRVRVPAREIRRWLGRESGYPRLLARARRRLWRSRGP